MSTEPHLEQLDDGPDALLDALVRGERAAMTPPEGAQAHTWERVAATVAVGGPTPMEPGSITGPTATVATAPWTKLVLGLVLGVAAVGGYRLFTAPSDPEPTVASRPDPAESATALVPAAQPRAAPPRPEPAVTPPPPEPLPDPPPAVAPERSETKAQRPARAASPTSDLAEETRLLAQARRRLAAGSARDALVPLREHARRFPNGQLTEDRMVLRAQALCESGQTGAGLELATALRKAFPSSSHLPRVDRACGS